jgi:hypothetical protein
MHRRGSAWFGASILLACIVSLAIGALVREKLRAEESFWLISPIVYLVRDQHLSALSPFLTPTLSLVLWLVVAVAVVVLIRRVRIGTPFIGGGLANVLEAQAIGSVTDFLGIHRLGTYSAGDIAMDVASSLLPIAVIQIARAQHQTFTHVLQAGAVFYAAVVIFAVASQDYALAFLVTLVMGGTATTWFSKRMVSPQIPPR